MEQILVLMAGLVYPGLLLALVLGVIYRRLLGATAGSVRLAEALRSREGAACLVGLLAAGVGVAGLPWPYHPAQATHAWVWSWAALEVAFLVPLAPALATGVPKVVRSAARRAQIGVLGRAFLWLALGSALTIHDTWSMAALPAHLLALGAVVVAFPIAVGWGPFDDEISLGGAGLEAGLPPELRHLSTLARDVATAALLAITLVAVLPTGIVPPWLALIQILAAFIVVSLILRRMAGRLPRLPLLTSLRIGWAYAAPLAGAACAALLLVPRG
ncbi:hypothetical protein OSCT_2735 [Oscillochloris trichoides DG-6]|uniref:Respiratory-chain NADH dehydrogenase subunit 1 n=1 Tax=Oscillochloris trichoides DG-6 TaxID=765420 RepID=E1IHD4_9CHLR|nr:hypothetical protein [Oscillochloris trichoides]EFO79387.1 hypothetical protein OSCT_2735 [Oscillochloris trichoides DG-6]